jgi:hypothetical protein
MKLRPSKTPVQETKKDEEIADTLAASAEAQEEAASILRQVAARLDSLSAEMRRHGAFPIAGQLEREQKEAQGRTNGLATGA